MVKNPPSVQETLGREDPLEEGMATVFLPGESHGQRAGGLQFIRSQRVETTQTSVTMHPAGLPHSAHYCFSQSCFHFLYFVMYSIMFIFMVCVSPNRI